MPRTRAAASGPSGVMEAQRAQAVPRARKLPLTAKQTKNNIYYWLVSSQEIEAAEKLEVESGAAAAAKRRACLS